MSEIVTFDGRVTPASDDPAKDEARIGHLLVQVGERVRAARARKGITRKVLSEMSGVSPRYLAQLESGQGNISIALLLKIGDALDFPIEWLVAEDDPWQSEAGITYRAAGIPALRADVVRYMRSDMLLFSGGSLAVLALLLLLLFRSIHGLLIPLCAAGAPAP